MDQALILMAVICIPPILGTFLVASILGRGEWNGTRWRSVLTLQPKLGLVHQGLLWISVAIPVCYFLALGLFAWIGHSIDLSADGFKKFIEISVLPLALLSISLPLAGLVSRLHATQQTALQIEVVSRKNDFDAFYSHRKEFFSYFAQIGSLNYLSCLDAEYKVHPSVHRIFFHGTPSGGAPTSKTGTFELYSGKLTFVAMMLDGVIRGKNDDEAFNCYLQACNDILWIAGMLGVREVSEKMVESGATFSVNLTSGQMMVATVGTSTVEILASYRYLRNYYNNICSFASIGKHKLDDAFHYLIRGGNSLLRGPDLVIERLHRTVIKDYMRKEDR